MAGNCVPHTTVTTTTAECQFANYVGNELVGGGRRQRKRYNVCVVLLGRTRFLITLSWWLWYGLAARWYGRVHKVCSEVGQTGGNRG